MFASDFSVRAAEFPNDNPLLHQGVRWVCPNTVGAARAVLRASDSDGSSSSAASDCAGSSAPPLPVSGSAASDGVSLRRYDGPLDLYLDRIVIVHRVENVPPPPDFIFRPFVPSRAHSPALAPLVCVADAPAIQPRPCRIVDEHAAGRRVQRGGGVDIAPCLMVMEPAAPAPLAAVAERTRRPRRRGPVSARALAVSALPDSGELARAISELEAAFAKPGLHSRSHEGARVSPCRADAV